MNGEPAGAPGSFGSGGAGYDEFVDWAKRLAREEPFFRSLFAEAGVRSVADVGAGSGRHAVMFASWGLHVIAVDPDEEMLGAAEAHAATHAAGIETAGGSIRVVRGSFGELAALGVGPVDALTCTGNALPHVDGRAGLRRALSDFAAVVRSGGVVVLHLLNHERLLEARPRSIPPVVRDTPAGTRVFLRVIGYPEGEDVLDFDFLTLTRDPEGEWHLSSRRSAHTALPLPLLAEELADAGFEDVRSFGAHDGRAFVPAEDESVIVAARRR